MEDKNLHIIEDLYTGKLLAEIENSQEGKKLLEEYNKFYETIEDKELKEQFSKLEEIKNNIYSSSHRDTFRVGFSVATKMIIEAITTEV